MAVGRSDFGVSKVFVGGRAFFQPYGREQNHLLVWGEWGLYTVSANFLGRLPEAKILPFFSQSISCPWGVALGGFPPNIPPSLWPWLLSKKLRKKDTRVNYLLWTRILCPPKSPRWRRRTRHQSASRPVRTCRAPRRTPYT